VIKSGPPFVIFALPRSRTYWLSRFLSYGGWFCAHEQCNHVRGFDDVQSWLSMPFTGTVETTGSPYWRTAIRLRRDIKIATIRRPISEVFQSLKRIPAPWSSPLLRAQLLHLNCKLDQIEARCANVKSVPFALLKHETTCADLFEFLLPYKHDHNRWYLMDQSNLQIDVLHQLRETQAHRPQMERASNIVKAETLRNLNRKRYYAKDAWPYVRHLMRV
jgi:hypothetical protein